MWSGELQMKKNTEHLSIAVTAFMALATLAGAGQAHAADALDEHKGQVICRAGCFLAMFCDTRAVFDLAADVGSSSKLWRNENNDYWMDYDYNMGPYPLVRDNNAQLNFPLTAYAFEDGLVAYTLQLQGSYTADDIQSRKRFSATLMYSWDNGGVGVTDYRDVTCRYYPNN